MKCPKCGREIPDGSLFCEYCAAEIKIVPEYETKVEEQISKGMESVTKVFDDDSRSAADAALNTSETGNDSDQTAAADSVSAVDDHSASELRRAEEEERRQQRTREREARYARRRRHVKFLACFLIGAISAAVLLILLYVFLAGRERPTQSDYVGRAYELASEGKYQEAADEIDKAIALTDHSAVLPTDTIAGTDTGENDPGAAEETAGTEESDTDVSVGSGNDRRGTGSSDQSGYQTDSTLYLLKAEYLQKAGEKDLALGAASIVLESSEATEDEIIAAYGRIISIYASYEEYDKIAQLLTNCKIPSVLQTYLQYTLFDPTFSAEDGSYEGSLSLKLEDQGDGSIFYTLDGTVPSTSSTLYTSPIVLGEGTYTVSAVYVNHFGLQSSVVSHNYSISDSAPAAPVISPKSGTYAKDMQITAELAEGSGAESAAQSSGTPDAEGGGTGDGGSSSAGNSAEGRSDQSSGSEEGLKIYYTTNGEDPTAEDTEYTGPISMPQGASTFKFAVVNEQGEISDVVEREYNLRNSASISSADGVNYILVALIRRGEIINTVGTRPDGLTMYTFTYTGTQQIGGVSYLMYAETLADSTGGTASTGRIYAVNASNGTVNSYSNGTLTPIG